MQHAANLVLGVALKLLALVTDAIGMVESFLRHLLESVGVVGPLETVVLLAVGLMLVVAAFGLFGRLFLALALVFVLLLLLRHLLPVATHAT